MCCQGILIYDIEGYLCFSHPQGDIAKSIEMKIITQKCQM